MINTDRYVWALKFKCLCCIRALINMLINDDSLCGYEGFWPKGKSEDSNRYCRVRFDISMLRV